MIDFEKMVACQRDYFLTQATKSYAFRMEQLKKLMDWINANEQDILAVLEKDLGKCAYEGYLTEVTMVKQELKDVSPFFALEYITMSAIPTRRSRFI